jgi:hypothetical protein
MMCLGSSAKNLFGRNFKQTKQSRMKSEGGSRAKMSGNEKLLVSSVSSSLRFIFLLSYSASLTILLSQVLFWD